MMILGGDEIEAAFFGFNYFAFKSFLFYCAFVLFCFALLLLLLLLLLMRGERRNLSLRRDETFNVNG